MFEIIEEGALLEENVKVGNYVTIKKGAKIGKNTVIGDYSYIDSNVVIKENNYIGTGVILKGNVSIGKNNHILDKTTIGLSPKHIGYHFYKGRVIIGDNNFISNDCSIDCGNNYLSDKRPELLDYLRTDLPSNLDYEDATIIGDRCYILNNVTIHHNCRVGLGNISNYSGEYDTIICSGCCLNGFVQLRKGCELSSGTYIREFASIGEGAFTAMMTHVVKDIPPFAFIRNNCCIGTHEGLAKKFKISKNEILKLRDTFEKKRSGELDSYIPYSKKQ
ncbi:MAG: hypothetical protein IJZ30_04270 [Alphaproteobacteria bacterium]|nr:hypothetical protein [Alphaproteobacteria bacterium]